MTKVYDNWERLVEAALTREQLRLIALAPSRDPSFSSSISADSNRSSSFKSDCLSDDVSVGYIFTTAIELANQVIKAADDAASFKQECLEIKSKTQTLAWILRQAARGSNSLYVRPMHRIMDETKWVLEKAVALLLKCRGVKRVLIIIPTAAFRKISYHLESSIGDVSWLVRISSLPDDPAYEYLGLPPIAANEPILCLIWEQIAILYTGSIDDKGDAAASLVSLARDNDRYRKLIIEEGGVEPLLKLLKEGKSEGQHDAARAITSALEMEDSAANVHIKEMAAKALWHLVKGNSPICQSIAESSALLHFAVLLEKGPEQVQYNSAMALMEITAVAEEDADLRKSAFNLNFPGCKAVVDQLVRVIEKEDSEALIPCVKAIRNLARTFSTTETRMISPLVKLLDE